MIYRLRSALLLALTPLVIKHLKYIYNSVHDVATQTKVVNTIVANVIDSFTIIISDVEKSICNLIKGKLKKLYGHDNLFLEHIRYYAY